MNIKLISVTKNIKLTLFLEDFNIILPIISYYQCKKELLHFEIKGIPSNNLLYCLQDYTFHTQLSTGNTVFTLTNKNISWEIK